MENLFAKVATANDLVLSVTSLRHVAVVGLAAILIACGGGGDGGATSNTNTSTGSPSTTSPSVVSSGPITGFGSVILNGVRFDDSSARITLDDSDSATVASMKLGMIVELEGSKDVSGLTGTATGITSHSFVQGPISAINLVNSQLTVLGVVVTVTPGTVFDGTTGLGTLTVDNVVEVHGFPDGSGGVKATRIEKKTTNEVRLIGTIQNMTATTFTVTGNTVRFLPANIVDPSSAPLVNGMLVRIKGTLRSDRTTIDVSSVRTVKLAPITREGLQVELEGVVTKFDSSTDFEVNGLRVNVTSNARREGSLALDSLIEVEGAILNNILVAIKVEVKDEKKADVNELHGTISTLDVANKSFTMRSGTIAVKWDNATRFDDSSLPLGAASLATNLKIEVKGKIIGNVVLASKIEIDK